MSAEMERLRQELDATRIRANTSIETITANARASVFEELALTVDELAGKGKLLDAASFSARLRSARHLPPSHVVVRRALLEWACAALTPPDSIGPAWPGSLLEALLLVLRQ